MYANPNVSGIIGLNAKSLATIQMVFDSVAVKLSVASVSKAILVRPINSEDVSVQAIIMPFRVD
jgi:DNA polymerase III sliding clamp (beta) subunit (PCNA family)